MLTAYAPDTSGQQMRLRPVSDLTQAMWVDVRGTGTPADQIAALQVDLPDPDDMSAIEISRRFYHRHGADYMTVFLPGDTGAAHPAIAPVSFILTPHRVITVHKHRVAGLQGTDLELPESDPRHAILALIGACVGDLADRLEDLGRQIQDNAAPLFDEAHRPKPEILKRSLVVYARAGHQASTMRVGLLGLERILNHLDEEFAAQNAPDSLAPVQRRLARDVAAMLAHADVLSARAAAISDTTLGLVDLEQNRSVSMLSAVVSLFAPATLISSIYGMNFQAMPELHSAHGFEIAIGSMVLSAIITFLFYRWRGWM